MGPGAQGAVVRIPHLPRREWERGPRESPAEPSARPHRGRGRGPAPAARPFPSRLPLPPKRSGAGPGPPIQEGCRAGSTSPRLLAAGCGPTAAGRRRTRRRAESGAAPPPFCPNAGRLLPGSTASRDRRSGLRCSRRTGAPPRAAAPRGRSWGARGSRAQDAPCTPRALRRSGRSRRSSLLARLPPLPPPRERPPHPLLPPPPRPPRRSGLSSQRLAAASAPGLAAAAAPAPAPRGHPQARLLGPQRSQLLFLTSNSRCAPSLAGVWSCVQPAVPSPDLGCVRPSPAPCLGFCAPSPSSPLLYPPLIPLPPFNPTSAQHCAPLLWPGSIGRFLSCQTSVRRCYWAIPWPGGCAKGGHTRRGAPWQRLPQGARDHSPWRVQRGLRTRRGNGRGRWRD